jgi:hypothetical protein
MVALSSYFSVVRTSPGQRISAYNQMRPIAERQGLLPLVRHVDRARVHDIDLRQLEARWAAQQKGEGLYPPELQVTDVLSDHTLTGIRDVAMGQIRGLPPGAPLRSKVELFLDDVFPGGVIATTSLRYVDQILAMEVIVTKLEGEHKDMVEELGLQKVRYLAELTAAYRRDVAAGNKPLEFAEVRARRDRGHELLLEVIALATGTYYDGDNPDHIRKREELLAPIRKQLDITHAHLRARRGNRPPETTDLAEDEAMLAALATLDALDDGSLHDPAGC